MNYETQNEKTSRNEDSLKSKEFGNLLNELKCQSSIKELEDSYDLCLLKLFYLVSNLEDTFQDEKRKTLKNLPNDNDSQNKNIIENNFETVKKYENENYPVNMIKDKLIPLKDYLYTSFDSIYEEKLFLAERIISMLNKVKDYLEVIKYNTFKQLVIDYALASINKINNPDYIKNYGLKISIPEQFQLYPEFFQNFNISFSYNDFTLAIFFTYEYMVISSFPSEQTNKI